MSTIETVSQKISNPISEKIVTQDLEKQIWIAGVSLLRGKDVQYLSSSDPNYIQMFIMGEKFLERSSVTGVDLAICGVLNEFDRENEEGSPNFDSIELFTFHKGYGVMRDMYSSRGEEMHRSTGDELKKLLKNVKESRVIEDVAGREGSIFISVNELS